MVSSTLRVPRAMRSTSVVHSTWRDRSGKMMASALNFGGTRIHADETMNAAKKRAAVSGGF